MSLKEELKTRIEDATSGKVDIPEPSRSFIEGVLATEYEIRVQVGDVVKRGVFVEKEGADPEVYIVDFLEKMRKAINKRLMDGLRKHA